MTRTAAALGLAAVFAATTVTPTWSGVPRHAAPAVFGLECWADAAPVSCSRRNWMARFLAVKEPELAAPEGGVSLRLAFEDDAVCANGGPPITVVRVQAAPGRPGSLNVLRCGTRRTTVMPAAASDRVLTLYRDATLQELGASTNLSASAACRDRVLEVTDGARSRAVYFNCSPPAGLDALVTWMEQRGPRPTPTSGLATRSRPAGPALPRSF